MTAVRWRHSVHCVVHAYRGRTDAVVIRFVCRLSFNSGSYGKINNNMRHEMIILLQEIMLGFDKASSHYKSICPHSSKEQYKKSEKCILIRTALHYHFYRDSKTNEVNKPVLSQKQKSYYSWLIEALENWPTQIHPYMWHTDPSYVIMYSTIREVRKCLSSPLQTAPCCECQNNESTCAQMDALLGECRNHDRPFFFFRATPTPLERQTHIHTQTRHPNTRSYKRLVMPRCHWDELVTDKQHKGSVRSEPKCTRHGTTHTQSYIYIFF